MAAAAFSCFTSYDLQSVATIRNLSCCLLPGSLKTGKFAVGFLKQVQPKDNSASKYSNEDIIGRKYPSSNGKISMKRLPIVAVSTQEEAVPTTIGESLSSSVADALEAVPTTLDLPVATKVKFVLQKECQFGQKFSVVGEDTLLGAWDPAGAFDLEWTEDHTWTGEVDLPIGKMYEFKFLLVDEDGKVEWQPGANRTFETVENESAVIVSETWQLEEVENVDDLQAAVTQEQSISEDNDVRDSEESFEAAEKPGEIELDGKLLVIETGNGSVESFFAVAQEEAKSND